MLKYIPYETEWHDRACCRKVRYRSIEEANRALDRMEQRTGESFNVYPCMFCWMYHIGHGEKPAKQRMRLRKVGRVGMQHA